MRLVAVVNINELPKYINKEWVESTFKYSEQRFHPYIVGDYVTAAAARGFTDCPEADVANCRLLDKFLMAMGVTNGTLAFLDMQPPEFSLYLDLIPHEPQTLLKPLGNGFLFQILGMPQMVVVTAVCDPSAGVVGNVVVVRGFDDDSHVWRLNFDGNGQSPTALTPRPFRYMGKTSYDAVRQEEEDKVARQTKRHHR